MISYYLNLHKHFPNLPKKVLIYSLIAYSYPAKAFLTSYITVKEKHQLSLMLILASSARFTHLEPQFGRFPAISRLSKS